MFSKINYFDNTDYVKLLQIENYNENFLSRYFPEQQTMVINYQKLIYSLSFDIAKNEMLKTYEERLFMLNLMILKTLFHEMQHVCQKKENDGKI